LEHNYLAEEQIERLVNDAAAYIRDQRQKYLERATPLSAEDKLILKRFFPNPILDMARFLNVENEKMENPKFLSQLNDQGFSFPDINSFGGTTFRDVIVWRVNLTSRLKFHELVHVTQYQKLGLHGFADKYMRGLLNKGKYRAIPLEEHAYELDERFIENPDKFFSVEAEVVDWMVKGRY